MADQSLSYDAMMTNIPLTISHEGRNGTHTYTLSNEDGPMSTLSIQGGEIGATDAIEGELMKRAGISAEDKYGDAPMWNVSWVE